MVSSHNGTQDLKSSLRCRRPIFGACRTLGTLLENSRWLIITKVSCPRNSTHKNRNLYHYNVIQNMICSDVLIKKCRWRNSHTPYPSVLDFWTIKFENSSLTNWIFNLQKSILKSIFACNTGSKSLVRRTWFFKHDFSKIKCRWIERQVFTIYIFQALYYI